MPRKPLLSGSGWYTAIRIAAGLLVIAILYTLLMVIVTVNVR